MDRTTDRWTLVTVALWPGVWLIIMTLFVIDGLNLGLWLVVAGMSLVTAFFTSLGLYEYLLNERDAADRRREMMAALQTAKNQRAQMLREDSEGETYSS